MLIKLITRDRAGKETGKAIIWNDELIFAKVSTTANGIVIRAQKEYEFGDENLIEITLDGIDLQQLKSLL